MLGVIVRALLRLFYRVEVKNAEQFCEVKDNVLVAINVGSLLDPVLVGSMLPERVTIVVDSKLAGKWWLRPILACVETIQVDFASPTSTLEVVRAIRAHKRCMVFHAGRFTNDPQFMRILEATGIIAEKAKAVLLPVRIDGAAYSRLSYFRSKVRRRWFPKITMTVLPPQKLEALPELAPRDRRYHMSVQLYKVMTDLLYFSTNIDQNIVQRMADCTALYGWKYTIMEDQERHTMTYGELMTKAQVLGRAMKRVFGREERIGLMLPNSLAAVVGFLALHVAGKVPAMINFTSGPSPVVSGCKTVQLKYILTSRRFIEAAELGPLEQALKNGGLTPVYMEDIAADLRSGEKIRGVAAARLGLTPKTPADAPVAILFTSGTEGLPKAVFMSHRNLAGNREQLLTVLNVSTGDRFFSCLPMFHTFGLGVGIFLPIASGIRSILYPSPLHYRIVPQLFYDTMATVICGTDTFATGYARYGRPYDFFNARLVIVGAEKLRDATYRTWDEKYGVKMVEGYGATETSPVLAVNTRANTRYGSVGRVLPGITYKLKPVDGIEEQGCGDLWVKGDNVMLGYMKADNPGRLLPPPWIRNWTGTMRAAGMVPAISAMWIARISCSFGAGPSASPKWAEK